MAKRGDSNMSSSENEDPLLLNEDDIAGKIQAIHAILNTNRPSVQKLRRMCVLPGGLRTNSLRKQVWPLILDANPEENESVSEDEMRQHRDYRVVELDVERLLKRYPPNLSSEDRHNLESTMKRVIMRTIVGTDHHYYQGFHDIAITVHLVLQDEETSVAVLRKLCNSHLKTFMMPTLLETVEMLQFIYPLIRRRDALLHDFLIRSDIGTMFALPWLITWYGHNIQETAPHTLVVRLCDLFISSDPTMPIYLGASIVCYLSDQILSLPDDQAEVHGFLNVLQTTLPWEQLIKDALDLYLQWPPAKIASEAAQVQQLQEEAREKRFAADRKTPRTRPVVPQPAASGGAKRWMKMGILIGVAVLVVAVGVAKYMSTSSSPFSETPKVVKSSMSSIEL